MCVKGSLFIISLWPPRAKSWFIGKDSDAGRDWRQEEKGTTEDEMAGWHHWHDGRESEWTLGVGDGQGGLACCDSWGRKESETTEWLNWTELKMEWNGNYGLSQYQAHCWGKCWGFQLRGSSLQLISNVAIGNLTWYHYTSGAASNVAIGTMVGNTPSDPCMDFMILT